MGKFRNGEFESALSGSGKRSGHICSPLRFGHEGSGQLISGPKTPAEEAATHRPQELPSFFLGSSQREARECNGEQKARRPKLNRLNRIEQTAELLPKLPITEFAHKARVVSDAAVAAILAALDMAPTGQARGLKAHERGRAALLDCRHHLQLTQAQVPGIGAAPIGSMAMKDVCDLQPRAAHGRPARPRVAASSRSMMRAGRVGWLWPGSSYWRRECKALWCRAWRDPEVFE